MTSEMVCGFEAEDQIDRIVFDRDIVARTCMDPVDFGIEKIPPDRV
jgi:hypothetical protein